MDLYRFRSIEKLLGFNELENQEIYFASPSTLNDPMEGFKDIFWTGDIIVWKNLFKHYLICLERLCSILVLYGEDHPILEEFIPIHHGPDDFPTQIYRENFELIAANFFSNETVTKFIKAISSRNTKVRQDEMLFYITSIHQIALETILAEYEKRSLILSRNKNQKPEDESPRNNMEKSLLAFVNMLSGLNVNESIPAVLFKAYIQIQDDYELLNSYHGRSDKTTPNKKMVFVDFPKIYLSRLEELTYPDWYTACFMRDCKNSSVWGHYGNNHKGVCLIYQAELFNDIPSIKIRKRVGYGSSGPIYDYVNCQFHPVSYIDGYTQIDFFRSLGTLPIPALNSTWYVDDGVISKCAEHLTSDNENWRELYWKHFYLITTTKSKDWAYENEYRLILNNMFGQVERNREGSAFKYEFRALKGIVFGINTRTEDKLKIIEIIERKCDAENRGDFKFYQASYSPDEKCIVHHEIKAFKFLNP